MAIDPDFAGLFAGWPFSGLTPAPTPDPSQGPPMGLLATPPSPPVIGGILGPSPSDLASSADGSPPIGGVLGASLDPTITAPSPFTSFKAGGLGSLGYISPWTGSGPDPFAVQLRALQAIRDLIGEPRPSTQPISAPFGQAAAPPTGQGSDMNSAPGVQPPPAPSTAIGVGVTTTPITRGGVLAFDPSSLVKNFMPPGEAPIGSGSRTEPAPSASLPLTDTAFNPFAPISPYIARANHYEALQDQLNSSGTTDSYYFDAVSKLTANLSNMDDWLFRGFANLSPAAKAYSNQLSQGISDFNDGQFAAAMAGKLPGAGPALDSRLVRDEQDYVQKQLNALAVNNPKLYNDFVRGVNVNANLSGLLQLADGATNYDVVTAAARARKLIGGPIDFANESHRIIMGEQLVNMIRSQQQALKAFNDYIQHSGPISD